MNLENNKYREHNKTAEKEESAGGHGGDLQAAARVSGLDPADILDFSSNVNPLGPPPGLKALLKKELEEINRYPVPQARELRAALAQRLEVPENRVLPGNGANDLLHLLLLWLRPRRVLVPAPSFSEYYRAATLAGAEVEHFSQPPGEPLKVELLKKKLQPGDLLVLCSPNNPSGTLYPGGEIEKLSRAAEKREAMLLVDESFLPLAGREEESLRRVESGHLYVLLSLTKLWALPGLRLGCLVGPGEKITRLNSLGDPWRVNHLAQQAGLYCLQQEGYLEKTLSLLEKERDYLSRGLQSTGDLTVYQSAANFLLARGEKETFNAGHLQSRLLEKGLLVRRADNFRGLDERFFRVAVRRRPENRRLLQAVEDYLHG